MKKTTSLTNWTICRYFIGKCLKYKKNRKKPRNTIIKLTPVQMKWRGNASEKQQPKSTDISNVPLSHVKKPTVQKAPWTNISSLNTMSIMYYLSFFFSFLLIFIKFYGFFKFFMNFMNLYKFYEFWCNYDKFLWIFMNFYEFYWNFFDGMINFHF